MSLKASRNHCRPSSRGQRETLYICAMHGAMFGSTKDCGSAPCYETRHTLVQCDAAKPSGSREIPTEKHRYKLVLPFTFHMYKTYTIQRLPQLSPQFLLQHAMYSACYWDTLLSISFQPLYTSDCFILLSTQQWLHWLVCSRLVLLLWFPGLMWLSASAGWYRTPKPT